MLYMVAERAARIGRACGVTVTKVDPLELPSGRVASSRARASETPRMAGVGREPRDMATARKRSSALNARRLKMLAALLGTLTAFRAWRSLRSSPSNMVALQCSI